MRTEIISAMMRYITPISANWLRGNECYRLGKKKKKKDKQRKDQKKKKVLPQHRAGNGREQKPQRGNNPRGKAQAACGGLS